MFEANVDEIAIDPEYKIALTLIAQQEVSTIYLSPDSNVDADYETAIFERGSSESYETYHADTLEEANENHLKAVKKAMENRHTAYGVEHEQTNFTRNAGML